MAGFVTRKPQDLTLVERALAEAAHKSSGRIITLYGRSAQGYLLPWLAVSLALPTVGALIALWAGLDWPLVLGAGIATALALFGGLWFTDAKVRLTPPPLRRWIVTRAVNRLVAAHLAQQPDAGSAAGEAATILVVVFQQEGFAQIVASGAAAASIPQKIWRSLLDALLIDLGHGEIARGLRNTVTACGKLLSAYFPPAPSVGAGSDQPTLHGGPSSHNRLQLV